VEEYLEELCNERVGDGGEAVDMVDAGDGGFDGEAEQRWRRIRSAD
jgi:hypothetical protein